MMAKTSINIKPCLVTSSGAHNRRLAEYLANIRKEKIYIRTDLMAKNETWVSPELGDTSLEERSRQIAAMVKKKTGRAMQTKDRKRVNKKTGKVTVVRGSTPIKEGVVVIKEDTAMEQLRHFCEVCKERWGITPLQIFIHRDEGHYETPGDKTTWKPNYHAHIVWDWMNHDTGKSCKLLPQDMSQMQTILAEALGMERGTSKELTGREHLERTDYIIAKQKQEAEKTRIAKEQAEAELKAVKGELRTEKLKNSAAEVGTTILDGIGSMIGTSKVKRQQQQIDTLKQEVAARDETIETLQTQMQTLRADHCKELMAVQARHMTETADIKKQYEKDLSFFQMLVRKASAWFPHFRELLRMDEFCRKIGFNDAQTETLIRGKSLKYSGTLYSEMHRKQFKAENVIARISPDETNGRKFILKIDGLPIVRWFREQAEKLQHCISSRHNMRML
ncbi:mobilization protein [Alistipes shahii]|nr:MULTISPECIES: mobilization protein [Alistipes]MCQ5074733.1 mobilization protein [Alistipes shahii]MDR3833431.1 mobilization protein [Alistipes sp.]MDR3963705.1 mobilization protein [Alistipes sp.]